VDVIPFPVASCCDGSSIDSQLFRNIQWFANQWSKLSAMFLKLPCFLSLCGLQQFCVSLEVKSPAGKAPTVANWDAEVLAE